MPPAYVWKNPLAVWGTATGNAQAPSIPVPDPRDTWRRNTSFKVQTYLVGRLRYFMIWPHHGSRTWNRTRWWPTRRNLLNIKGLYSRKTATPEKKIIDRRPIYWLFCLCLLLAGPLLFPQSQTNALLTAGATFGIFAAINVCWTLIIGTASIFSLATYAVVGTAAFVTSLLSIRAGIPWFALPPIGAFIGLGFGILIAAPALRLDGFYYALADAGAQRTVSASSSPRPSSLARPRAGSMAPILSSTKTGRHSPSRSSPTTLRLPAYRIAFSFPVHQWQTAWPRAAHGA